MILDCDKYKLSLPFIRDLTKDLTQLERLQTIGIIAIASGVPIIVVATFIGELWGYTIELEGFIERLKTFYMVEEIVNEKII